MRAPVKTDSEQLLMEVLNSAPVTDSTVADELADEAGGRAWLRAHGLQDSVEEWRSMLKSRELLWAVVRGEETAEVFAGVIEGSRFVPTAQKTGLAWQLETPDGRDAATRLVMAWDELGAELPGRLRPCANPECRLFLLDHSKNNTGRWCSMAVCGNRMKARRHHARSTTEG